MKKLFITGIGGCVGHYLFDLFCYDPNYELYLLVRSPEKLKFNPDQFPAVKIIKDDLKNIEKYADLVKQMDYVIHLAADWGGNEGNYDYSLSLLNLLDPAKCKKVIYFSTASILGPDNKPLEEAEKFGTHYIRSKYRMHRYLPRLRIYPNVITLFPTWVLGGDAGHPYSHAMQGVIGLKKWLWLIRFLTADVSFHFIHAKDIALITKYLLETETEEKEFVLGNSPITAGEFIRQTCAYFSLKVYFQLAVPTRLVQFLALLAGRKLHPWDLYSLNRRHFVHKTVNAENFRILSKLKTVSEILQSEE
jgi:nucleoside-diphosphate-sugar epimerase